MTRVLFFGMIGGFSIPPLERLLAAGVEVAGVILPAPQPAEGPRRVEPPRPALSDLPLVDPYLSRSIVHLAWAAGIPVWEVGRLAEPAALALLAALQPDLLVVACFSRRFPPELLHLARHGALNLHPSLLPAYRGPAPLFWQARQDERRAGVTLHVLDEGLDTGDIVAQAAFERTDGLRAAEWEQRCAAVGADLLLAAVRHLATGSLPRRPQPDQGASYFPWPAGQDFIIPATWPARRAFNFLCGAEGWPLVIGVNDQLLPVRAVISYAADELLSRPYLLSGDELQVQFTPGVVRVRV